MQYKKFLNYKRSLSTFQILPTYVDIYIYTLIPPLPLKKKLFCKATAVYN